MIASNELIETDSECWNNHELRTCSPIPLKYTARHRPKAYALIAF